MTMGLLILRKLKGFFILLTILVNQSLMATSLTLKDIPGYDSDTEVVKYPGGFSVFINKHPNSGLVVKFQSKEGAELRELSIIIDVKSLAQFSGQRLGLSGIERKLQVSGSGEVFPTSHWFAIESKSSLHILIKTGIELNQFDIPFEKDLHLAAYSVSPIFVNGKYYQLVSYSFKGSFIPNSGRTYLLDSEEGTLRIVSEKFFQLEEFKNNLKNKLYEFDEKSLRLKFGHMYDFDLKTILSAQSYKVNKVSPGQVYDSSSSHPKKSMDVTKNSSSSDKDHPSNNKNSHEEKPFEPSSVPVDNASFSLNYNNKTFRITINKEGIFVTRESDNVKVKISVLQQLPAVEGHKMGGFVLEDGILKHPHLLRQIDLGKTTDSYDVFKVEANYSPIEESKESLEWVLENFKDFRKKSSKNMSPIAARKLYVDKVFSQMTGPESSSSIMVSEASDRDLILSEVSKKLPRTWKVLTFDPSGFGDLSMSGQKGEKAGKVSSAIKSVPIVLAAPKVTNLAGVGSAQGSSSDVMNLLTPDITDESSGWRLMGTVADSNLLRESFKDPDLRNNLLMTSLPDLSLTEVRDHLKQYLGHTLTKVTISEEVLDYLIAKGNQSRKTESEPGRSQNFLTAIARKIEAGPITKEEVNKALSYHFNISSHLISVEGQNKTLNEFERNARKNLAGHRHLISNFSEGLEIGFAGLHSEKGAMQTLWIEGPPGVGKTEFAKQMAKAMNVPLGYIDMNQYSSASRQSSGDLLAAIAKKLEKNPNSVILLDEVEKADFTVLQGLLMIFSNEYFEYPVDDGTGKKEMRRMDCNGASFVLTSNGIGDMVLRWLMEKIESDPKFDHISSEELNKEFFKDFSRESLLEMLTTAGMLPKIPNGLPSPLLDRVDLMVAFPPNFDGMVGLLKIKLREMRKRAYESMGVKIKLSSDHFTEEQIIKEMVLAGRTSQQSVRTQIREFEKKVQGTIALIRRSEPEQMSRVKFYLIDPKRKQFQRFSNKCLAGYVF